MTLSFLVSWANVSWSVSVECYALIIILGLIVLLSFNIVIVMIILVIVLLWWLGLLLENRLILAGVVDKILSIISSSISIEPFLVVYTNILLLINYLPITISSLLIHQLILWYLCIGVYLLMLVWRIPINTIGVI